ncbi:Uma2 family endonuclease [Thermus caldifontis]|uniref:Uma2 family endonuclease n=1 Tax=Thermus caldifontis TaxID=1930763 RepID=UPI000DF153CB|nr:Uma2 family endonuclease [Thermus caldifontis]
MGEPAKPLRQLTAEEYLAWEEAQPERHELVEGVPFAMAGATEAHNLIVGNLFYRLRPKAQERGCRVFVSEMRLRISPHTFYYPDLMVVCQEDAHPLYKERPCLVVEVLSQSTEATDRREKLWRYLRLPSLQGYLLVDSRYPRVEVYFRGPEGWLYRAWGPEDGEVEVPCLGVGVSLGEIYEGVELGATS